jgi:integrase
MGKFNREQYKSGQHALTKEQVNKLLLSFSNLQDKAMVALAIAIGLRREDLVSIKRNDYKYNPETDRGTITYYERKKKRTRTVFIPSPETVQLLNMHLNSCRKNEWLFPSPLATETFKDAHVSSRHAYDVLNDRLDICKIERRPFHALRATCYKLAKARKWSPREAAELLGDSLRVAEEHYAAPSVDDMQKAAEEKPLF